MKSLMRISGIALCACLVVFPLSLLFPDDPELHRTSFTGTTYGIVVEGQVLYQRGFVEGVADYSVSTGKKKYSDSEALDSIVSGETAHTPIEWSVNWEELIGGYISIWLLVGLVWWWWNQDEPHRLEKPNNSEDANAGHAPA